MRTPRGFSLLEVVFAVALLGVAVLAVSMVVLAAARTQATTYQLDVARLAAREKIEQVRALAWTSDGRVPVSDFNTDLTQSPPRGPGGVGLGASPGDTLRANIAGYSDFLDAGGAWLLGGPGPPPPGTAWVRRWSVSPLDGVPDLLAVQVLVVPLARSSARDAVGTAQSMNGAWLVSYRARSAP